MRLRGKARGCRYWEETVRPLDSWWCLYRAVKQDLEAGAGGRS